MTVVPTVPLSRIVPEGMTDYKCRSLLRSQHKFQPYHGRWVFTKAEAARVTRYLESNVTEH